MSVFQFSTVTDTAGTAFGVVIPPVAGKIARVNEIIYTSGATAHTVYVMRPVGKTTSDGQGFDVASLDIPVSNVNAMPAPNSTTSETIAASDYMAWLDTDGKYQFGEVAGVSANVVSLSASYPPGVPDGSPVWIFGELARAPHLAFSPPVSATTKIPLVAQGGVPVQLDSSVRSGVGDPILVLSNNLTAAGTLVSVTGSYEDDWTTS
jgi:hypothetical protein